MSLQGTPIKEDGLHHDHYTYVMTFDSIGKQNSRTKCSLCEQTKLQQNQLCKDYWKQTDSQYLAYSGETHCTYIDTIKATNQASCAPDIVNKDIIPNVNEYSTSKPDCLIYHEGSICRQHISALNVQVMDMSRIDSLEANLPEDDSLCSFGLNKCFCNMFGSGTKLATMLLRMGKIVKEVTMYGIVVSMQDHTKVSTLKMTMDFSNRQCTYWRVRQQMYNNVG